MSLFRRKGSKSKVWLCWYIGPDGRPKTRSTGTTERKTAETRYQFWRTEARNIREGIVNPDADQVRLELAQPIDKHLDEWENDMRGRGCTDKHAKGMRAQVKEVATTHHLRRAAEITTDIVGKYRASRVASGSATSTVNAYVVACKAFSTWLFMNRKAQQDTLKLLKPQKALLVRKCIYRALLREETALLLANTAKAGKIMGLDGGPRALLYVVAAGTGYRRNELKSIKVSCINLDSAYPSITVQAMNSKRRKEDVQPIHPSLAQQIRKAIKGKSAGDSLFIRVPERTAEMIRRDLARTREAWIAQGADEEDKVARRKSDFLTSPDSAGRVVQFRSLRRTYITQVIVGGASVKAAQDLARHSTSKLTMSVYAQSELKELSQAAPPVPIVFEGEPEAQAEPPPAA